MKRWQDNLIDYIPVLVFVGTIDMLKKVLAFEIEEQLGRKLTDWDWQVYWEEMSKKAEFEAEQKMHMEWQARFNDRKIIHDFVWNNEIS